MSKISETADELVDNQQLNTPTNIADDLDEDEEKPTSSRERRKIEIKFIQDKSRRHITFSKRKAGIMKKAYELSVLTGTQVLLLVVSETGLVYTFTTPKLQPLVTKPEGKNLIQACLNAPEEPGEDDEDESAQAGAGSGSNAANSQQHDSAAAAAAVAQQQHQQQHQQHQAQAQAVQQQQQQQQAAAAAAAAGQQGQPGYPQQLPQNGGYLNAEQAAVYQTYFGNMNNQQGSY